MRATQVTGGALLFLVGLWACGGDEDFTGAAPAGAAGAGGTDAGILSEGGTLNGLSVINPLCGTGVDPRACDDCVAANCEVHLSRCFGDTWRTTLDGGVCGSFGQCVMACPCGDSACFRACVATISSSPDNPCFGCLLDLFECEKASCEVECLSERDAGGGDSGRSETGPGGHGNQ